MSLHAPTRTLSARAATGLVLLATACWAAPAVASAPIAPLVNASAPQAVDGEYIVVMSDDAPAAGAESVAATATALGARISHRFDAGVQGFSATLPASALDAVRRAAGVAYVEQDTAGSIATRPADVRPGPDNVQPSPTWGLDRIDQRSLRYDDKYQWRRDGTGVSVYVVNTGIRFSHDEFEGRAITGPDFYQPDQDSSDCTGFGTHAAATIGGKTYGVAKQATLVALRVTNCDGEAVVSDVIAAVDWVTANADGPSVIALSGQFAVSRALNSAIAAAADAGIPAAVPAGDFEQDSCVISPAQEPSALTVAAADFDDTGAVFSSYGTCVDLYAPGVNTISAWNWADETTAIISGTDSAAAHAAGALAKLVEKNPDASAAEINHKIVARSTAGRLDDLGPGSPNQLLFSRRF